MSAALATELGEVLEQAPLYDALLHALRTFQGDLRIACSFGVEDMVILHEASRAARELGVTPRVFLLDTGRLHQETYDLLDRAREHYGIPIETYAPEAVSIERLVRHKGPNSFLSSVDNRLECCAIRKVAPLARALAGARAWVTGLRREQAATRAGVGAVEVEPAGGLLKLNPLAHWTHDRVWAFVREHGVPTHPLHERGYPSIGCAPCTRSVAPGEDPRSGRWWWESAGGGEHKECGIHLRGARPA
jgi:phosphoadenosine phosphosulfate reductase